MAASGWWWTAAVRATKPAAATATARAAPSVTRTTPGCPTTGATARGLATRPGNRPANSAAAAPASAGRVQTCTASAIVNPVQARGDTAQRSSRNGFHPLDAQIPRRV